MESEAKPSFWQKFFGTNLPNPGKFEDIRFCFVPVHACVRAVYACLHALCACVCVCLCVCVLVYCRRGSECGVELIRGVELILFELRLNLTTVYMYFSFLQERQRRRVESHLSACAETLRNVDSLYTLLSGDCIG